MSDSAFSRKRAMAVLRSRPFLTFAIVALVWVVAGFASRGFGSYGHLRYLIELAAVIGLVAAGQTFVVIAGGIDLSVAAIVTVSAVGLPLLTWNADPTGATAVMAVLAVTTVIGLANGLGVALLRVHPMIMTLAMATFLQGLLIIIAGGSDYCGFPMRSDVEGTLRKRILMVSGIGLRKNREGRRVRKAVAGNTIFARTAQLNLKVTKHGAAPLTPVEAAAEQAE